ncbi:putative reverse transcriptase domain-containing protein [Tanacetum coccineum]
MSMLPITETIYETKIIATVPLNADIYESPDLNPVISAGGLLVAKEEQTSVDDLIFLAYALSQSFGFVAINSDYGYALDRVRMSLLEFNLSGFFNKDTSPKDQNVLPCALFSEIVKRLGQHMSALEYRTILKYRLMIPLFPVDEPCLVCHKVCLDSFGEHAVHCKGLPGFKYMHDLVRDVLYDVLKRAGISSKNKAPGKYACVDLTGVSPLVGLGDNGFVARQAALKAESSKVAKHEKACLENQHVFIPFTFDTFGFLAPKAEDFWTRVQRVVQNACTLVEQARVETQISSTDGQSCSGQTPKIAWEGFQKKSCVCIKFWRGKRFSCKIDGAEVYSIKETLGNDEPEVGSDIVKRALGYPMKLIAKNADCKECWSDKSGKSSSMTKVAS